MSHLLFNNSTFRLIFDNAASIRIDERVPAEQRENKRRQRINSIKEQCALLMEHSDFRAFLRHIHSTALEDILFGNHEDPVNAVAMPTDAEIATHYGVLNQKYGYASLADDAPMFIPLFKLCKVFADFIENNNTQDNRVAYSHAYKLFVLLGKGTAENPFAKAEAFIKQHGQVLAKHDQPIHELLIRSIPQKQEPQNHPPLTEDELQRWQKLIQHSGIDAIILFQQAVEINRLLKRSPINVHEAIQASASVSYAQSVQYPKLAQLCAQYHLSEHIFNRCLIVEEHRKKSDCLPSVMIDGATLQDKQHPEQQNYPGYYLVKLPIDDPRAYILGHITNCCQSIGGLSAECVVDGITRENNGFYVLLKGKPVSANAGKDINLDNLDIVGQGYAWITLNGNLTIDSWENRTPAQDDPVIIAMLEKFGEMVTSDPRHPGIVQVTIGTGGKTPFIAGKRLLDVPEQMKEGTQYVDSRYQRLIYLNQEKQDALQQELTSIFADMTATGFADIATALMALGPQLPISYEFCTILKTLFLQNDSLAQWRLITDNDLANMAPIVGYIKDHSKDSFAHLNMLAILQHAKLLTKELWHIVLKNPKIDKEYQLLQRLETLGCLESPIGLSIVTALFSYPQHTQHPLLELGTAGYLADKDMYDVIAALFQYSKSYSLIDLARFFIRLNKDGLLKGELAKPLRTSLIYLMHTELPASLPFVPDSFNNIERLYAIFCNTALRTIENKQTYLQALATHPRLSSLPEAFHLLEKAGLLNSPAAEDYCAALAFSNKAVWPPNLAQALVNFQQSPLSTDNRGPIYLQIIAKHSDPIHAYQSLILLQEAGFLADPFALAFQELIATHPHVRSITNALLTLKQAGLLKNAAEVLFLLKDTYPEAMANLWCVADKLHLSITNGELQKKLSMHAQPETLGQITEQLQTFLEAHLLPDEAIAVYFETILLHPSRIALGWVLNSKEALEDEDTLLDNFKAIVTHPRPQALARQLTHLKTAGLLQSKEGDVYRQAIAHANNNQSVELTWAFCYLQEKGLLTEENATDYRQALMAHAKPNELAQSFIDYVRYGLSKDDLNKATMKALATHADPRNLVYALYRLHHHNLLQKDTIDAYRDALSHHPHPEQLASTIIDRLNDSRFNLTLERTTLLAKITELADDVEHLQGTRAQCFTIGKDEKARFLRLIHSWGEKKFNESPLLSPVIKRFLLELTQAACAEKRNRLSFFKPHSLLSLETWLNEQHVYSLEMRLFSAEDFYTLKNHVAKTSDAENDTPLMQIDAMFQQCLDAHHCHLNEDTPPSPGNSTEFSSSP